jgi:hypothetical protein
MNLVLDIEQFDIKNINFYEPVKNTVMNDSSFIRIIYSNKDFLLNGIYIKINISNEPSRKHDILEIMETLEKNILKKYNSNKIQTIKLKDQLSYLINKNNLITYILKISGIWETNSIIGLTYKFIYTHELLPMN